MSRLGKKPLFLPEKVAGKVEGRKITITGPLGVLSFEAPDPIEVKIAGNQITVERHGDDKHAKSCHGLVWSMIRNMIVGTTVGYKKELLIEGVGYKAQKSQSGIQVFLGYTKPVEFPIPKGITCEVTPPKDNISAVVVKGIDKQLVGDVAARIRKLKIPDPYKHKGVRYKQEVLRKKIGKRAIAQT
jgi:large subunit ribosomal protein L6